MALPIVQQIGLEETDFHRPFVHWYRVERRKSRPSRHLTRGNKDRVSVSIVEEDIHILPIWSHVDLLIQALRNKGFEFECRPKLQHLTISSAQLIGLGCFRPV